MKQVKDFKTRVLFSKEDLHKRISHLGEQISRDYGDQEIIVIGVLKGSVIFMTDLIRQITSPLEIDFIGVSSYEGTASSGKVRITHDLKKDISGKHVLVVEDIIDSGLTMSYLIRLLEASDPLSVKICSLLSKPESHQTHIDIDYLGFEISKEFVIGYGLDLDEKFREIPEIIQIISEK